ncbi:MAG: c-type cytochrome, partial [Isosphaeraceae bacterium]|nr:c-type cytochrome [Isosphaeraceae bacterium]
GTLIALDQMDHGGLTPQQVIPLLDPTAPDLLKTALQVIASHPDWADEMLPELRRWLARDLDEVHRMGLRQQLLAFCRDAGIQGLIAEALHRAETPIEMKVLLLEVMARAPLDGLPTVWIEALHDALGNRDERVVRQAVATVHSAGLTGFDAALLRLASDSARSDDLRVEALDTIAPRLRQLAPPLFAYLRSFLNTEGPPLLRLTAARALGRAVLDDGQLLELADEVAEAGALQLPRLLPAFERSSTPEVGAALVRALAQAPGLASLSVETLQEALKRYPPEVRRAGEALRKRLAVTEEEKASRLAELEPLLQQGDPRHGREVFFGPKATCSTCHTVGQEGGHVGPDLSRIGAVRSGRDLLEAVLFPSASFARGFEPYVIATDDGRVHAGLITRETAEAIYLISSDRIEIALPRASIESIEQGRVSVMPRGLDGNLSRRELADLLAFLQSLK